MNYLLIFYALQIIYLLLNIRFNPGEIMIIIRHSIETKASREDVWNIWQDAKNWNTWDNVTEYCSIDGITQGATGTWKPKEGPALQMKVTRVEPLKEFVTEFKLFLARVISYHYLTESSGKTVLTEQIEIKGPLAFLFAYHVGKGLKKSLPKEMEALIKKAESLRKA
jgi:hypothetical protein